LDTVRVILMVFNRNSLSATERFMQLLHIWKMKRKKLFWYTIIFIFQYWWYSTETVYWTIRAVASNEWQQTYFLVKVDFFYDSNQRRKQLDFQYNKTNFHMIRVPIRNTKFRTLSISVVPCIAIVVFISLLGKQYHWRVKHNMQWRCWKLCWNWLIWFQVIWKEIFVDFAKIGIEHMCIFSSYHFSYNVDICTIL